MSEKVTDAYVKGILIKQGIDVNSVEFLEDYTKEHPTTKFYRSPKGRIAVCQGLPKVNCNGVKICGNNPNETTVGWAKAGNNYKGKPNVFSANTVGTKVSLERLDNKKRVKWSPQLFLDGVEKPCSPNPALLNDKDNPNYSDNVLEWDYKICKRRLRVIEGAILERWLFNKNPNGEVRIKHNQSGDLKLLFGEYQVNDDEELIPKEVFNEAEYPFEIGASLTVFSTSSDGVAKCLNQATWNICHDAANGTAVDAVGSTEFVGYTNKDAVDNWDCMRTFFYFVTSALGATATITAAVFSLKGTGTAIQQADAGDPDIAVVEGVQSDPFDLADYGDHKVKTTKGQDAYFDADTWDTGDYNDITLNETGRGWINKTGTTLFCVRNQGDITDHPPSASPGNYILAYFEEQGVGSQPKLVITYWMTYARTAPVIAIGLVPTASRTLVLYRSATKAIGLVPTASRLLILYRTATKAIGLVPTASRALIVYRSAIKAIGLVPTASRALVLYRTATKAIGLVPTASRKLVLYRTASDIIAVHGYASFLLKAFRRHQAFTNVRSIVSATVRAISSFTNVRRHE